jgi:hypothetical protein
MTHIPTGTGTVGGYGRHHGNLDPGSGKEDSLKLKHRIPAGTAGILGLRLHETKL